MGKRTEENNNNKIIHYFWFGGNPLSELTKKCIETWKKYLPDFEIKAWNENNFDVNQCTFVKEAYEQKKWAFVADYARFKALEEYGGLYLDTDMEITADISKYLEHDLFLGCEDSKMINAAVVWAKEKNNKHIANIVKFYESMEKFNPTGDLYEMSVPRVLTSYFEKYGFNKELEEVQVLDNNSAYIYPMEYFYPLSYDYQHNKFTENSCMIHHFDATWISKMEKFKTDMKRKNMIWVVYLIDFFISVKNKIKFFSNYRDITIFVTMFFVMLACMFALKPISNAGMFSILDGNTGRSILQIIVASALWTFLCAKVRNINLNFYCDKMTNTDTSDEEYKEIKLNLEQTVKFQTAEKVIYVIQYILTLIVAFFPILEIFTVVPNQLNEIFYLGLMVLNLYYIYVGINKDFKYRILELVPYAIMLALYAIIFPSTGILISIFTFAFIVYELMKNKVKSKRKKSFVITYVVALIVCLIINFAVPNWNHINKMSASTSIFTLNKVEEYDEYGNEEDSITEFNAAKDIYGNRFKELINKKSLLLYPNLYVYISIILSIILVFMNQKKEYISLGILVILNSIFIMGYDLNLYIYIATFIFFALILFMIQSIINKFLKNT
ncbi:MAG: capsular polysaccharide synthesis protein [Clostridia bacterium]|nr:capsular polysaccharide synthesis protein [Clostridia bacterium]